MDRRSNLALVIIAVLGVLNVHGSVSAVWTEGVKLNPSDTHRWNYFGIGVAIDDEYAIVGSTGSGDICASGAGYIFKHDGNSWHQQAKLSTPYGATCDQYGVAVAISGDYAIVSAVRDKDNGDFSGAAYTFKRDGTIWTPQTKLTPADGQAHDNFGYSVAIAGKHLIAGATSFERNTGSAYVFKRLNGAPVACIWGGDRIVEADSNCETMVILDGSCSSDEDSTEGTNDDINDFDWYEIIDPCDANSDIYLGSDEIIECNLPLGEHDIMLEVTDKADAYYINEVTIQVEDVTPPEFSLWVEPNILWPVNHKMVEIRPGWEVSDNCDEWPDVSLVSITMNEDAETKGSGRTIGDIVVDANDGIQLRAERSGTSTGRIYTITYQAVDDSNNVTVDSAIVTVPHDMR